MRCFPSAPKEYIMNWASHWQDGQMSPYPWLNICHWPTFDCYLLIFKSSSSFSFTVCFLLLFYYLIFFLFKWVYPFSECENPQVFTPHSLYFHSTRKHQTGVSPGPDLWLLLLYKHQGKIPVKTHNNSYHDLQPLKKVYHEENQYLINIECTLVLVLEQKQPSLQKS